MSTTCVCVCAFACGCVFACVFFAGTFCENGGQCHFDVMKEEIAHPRTKAYTKVVEYCTAVAVCVHDVVKKKHRRLRMMSAGASFLFFVTNARKRK